MPYSDLLVRAAKRREKRWADLSPESKRRHGEKKKARTQELRIEAIKLFGGRCVQCGFADERALQFDHIYGLENGSRELRVSRRLYLAIKRGSIGRADLQLLCANCHIIKTRANRENIEHRKLGPRRRLSRIGEAPAPPRTIFKVWLICRECEVPYLRARPQHAKRKFCSHGCATRYAVKHVDGWGHTNWKRLPLFTTVSV